MVLGSPLPEMLMSSIAEWGVWGHLAVAKFVIARFWDVESDWTISSQNPFALTVAHWVNLTMSAWTPVVGLASLQVRVGWENTSVSGHGSWSISALLVGSAFAERNDLLMLEIGNIVHWFGSSLLCRWSHYNRIWRPHVSLVSLHLNSSWAIFKLRLARVVSMTYSTLTKCLTFSMSAVLGLYSSSGKR